MRIVVTRLGNRMVNDLSDEISNQKYKIQIFSQLIYKINHYTRKIITTILIVNLGIVIIPHK